MQLHRASAGLPGRLEPSREYQDTVSNALREQLLSALRELLAGLQCADRIAGGRILDDYRTAHLHEVYTGLVTVLMRMVFVLYAEERALLPMESELYANAYSLTRLYAQLRVDRERHGDAMDDRFGAWARVISLFRVLHDGLRAADGLHIPPRRGTFFDPSASPFLEGRPRGSVRHEGTALEVPRISDAVVFRILDKLLVIDGERLLYKELDVEQLGSVYEGLMGFDVEIVAGTSAALTPEHVVVNLDAILAIAPSERAKQLTAIANTDITDKAAGEIREAKSVNALFAALSRRISSRQPGLLATGTLVLQPGEERRRSGSHYTPRALTQPIVETTLRPILERLGEQATAEQLLALKICDPSMGSGAFLVEVCRQLADRVVEAWRRTGSMPNLPADEDPVLHARRLVAQRCLYGVDKNPIAVELARLSLWLVTFAREHPFTFVDHSLRGGDSLIGLSREQIVAMNLDAANDRQIGMARAATEPAVKRAESLRRQIHAIEDPPETDALLALWRDVEEALATARALGDLLIAAFFSADSDKPRRKAVARVASQATQWLQSGAHDAELRELIRGLREGKHPIEPFHWEIEFPEVFANRGAPGFDAIVGNPPWVSYAGRAAQPLDDRRRAFYGAFYRSFAGYRNLQAVFVEVSARLLREGGRLGLVIPSSMAELDGYVPSRAAHDAFADCDAELPDLGEDSFRGVEQPSMVLHSTRRGGQRTAEGSVWPIARPDLDDDARALLAKIEGPTLPPGLFGERGLQSSGPSDADHFHARAIEGDTAPIRAGGDIRAFERRAASLHAEVAWFSTRLRGREQWETVKVLIRQTARVPIAARSDGSAFRNSILAGFENEQYPADFLVAYLNSTPVRWCHYYRHRDARLGMPQVKIGHLRAIPAPRDPSIVAQIAEFGRLWSSRNEGIDAAEQARLDALVASGLGLGDGDLDRMRRDAAAWT